MTDAAVSLLKTLMNNPGSFLFRSDKNKSAKMPYPKGSYFIKFHGRDDQHVPIDVVTEMEYEGLLVAKTSTKRYYLNHSKTMKKKKHR